MPQNRHCSIRRRDVGMISVSGPVDVIVPFDVLPPQAIVDGEAIGSVVTVIELDSSCCWWLLLLLRVARFVARADIRRFRSSRSNDLSGETCPEKKRTNKTMYPPRQCMQIKCMCTLINDVNDDDGIGDSVVEFVTFGGFGDACDCSAGTDRCLNESL